MKRLEISVGIVLLFALLLACEAAEPTWGVAEQYTLLPERLAEGVVNKYYAHTDPGPNQDTRTAIRYEVYQLTGPDEITVSTYNPGFEQYGINVYTFQENETLVTKDTSTTWVTLFERKLSSLPFFTGWKMTAYRHSN